MGAGEIVQSITASAVPPSESLSRCVSFELRYGTCASRVSLDARVEMTSPSVVSDWLMAMLSCRRSAPSPASLARSEPARSTSAAREVTTLPRPSSAGSVSERVSTCRRLQAVAGGEGDGGRCEEAARVRARPGRRERNDSKCHTRVP